MHSPEMLDGEVEILHLHKRMELDGDIWEHEISYMSDHQVFHRIAKNGAWDAWSYFRLWTELKDVYQVARNKEVKGWSVEWNPNWQPGLSEFARRAKL